MDKRNEVVPKPHFHPRLIEIGPPGAGKSVLVDRIKELMREGRVPNLSPGMDQAEYLFTRIEFVENNPK